MSFRAQMADDGFALLDVSLLLERLFPPSASKPESTDRPLLTPACASPPVDFLFFFFFFFFFVFALRPPFWGLDATSTRDRAEELPAPDDPATPMLSRDLFMQVPLIRQLRQ